MTVSRLGKLVCEVGGARSLTEANRLRTQPVTIEVGIGEGRKLATLAHVAAALALRTQRGSVRVSADPRAPGLCRAISRPLIAELADQAATYGESDRFELAAARSCGGGVRVCIGDSIGDAHTRADAAGWISAVNRQLPADVPAEAAACAFAVASAFAKQFHARVLGQRGAPDEQWSISLRTFQIEPPVIEEYDPALVELGRVGLLGAGAIGSAFAYVLRLAGWRAQLDILDRGDYEEPNEETTCVVTRSDVFRRLPKAPTLAAAVRSGALDARGHKVEVFASSPELREPRDLFVCGVDNPETRRALDHVAAPVLVNAAVGGSRLDAGHVLMSRHGPGDATLSSIYPRRVSDDTATGQNVPEEIQDDCSRVAYEGISLAAPFIATAAAALAVAECGRRVLDDETGPNYVKLDVFGQQHAMQLETKRR